MSTEDPTTGAGYTEITIILPDTLVRRVTAGRELTRDEYAEVVAAFIRASGAGVPERPTQ